MDGKLETVKQEIRSVKHEIRRAKLYAITEPEHAQTWQARAARLSSYLVKLYSFELVLI